MTKDIAKRNETVTANAREIGALQAFFPACFDKEGNFDLAKFQELLKDKVSLKREGYGLNFLGKNYARMLASLDSTTVVVPDEEHNSKPENKDSENIYITGDNLDGLKQLLHSYSGRIKCIYIDPPYNTGSDGFVYNDKFTFTAEGLAAKLSIDEDEAERILKLTKKGSASHSAWLMFMYPRLMLARDMLRDDGVIFISIDDNEQANLKLLCDDVFGEQNCIGVISRVTKKGGNKGALIKPKKDYVMVYGRNVEYIDKEKFCSYEDIDEPNWLTETFNGVEREYIAGEVPYREGLDSRPNQRYYIECPDGSLIIPPGNVFPIDKCDAASVVPQSNGDKCWTWSKERYIKERNEGRFYFYETTDSPFLTEEHTKSKWGIKKKIFKSEVVDVDGSYYKKRVLYDFVDFFPNSLGTEELKELEIPFSYPKPSNLIKYFIDISTDEKSIILDFFSGSASSAHAVMQLNVDDIDSKRKYIMVQLAENVKEDSEAALAGYTTIDEIGRKRIELAAAKIKAEHPDTKADLGYRHFTLAEPSQETLDKLEKFVPEAEDGLDNMLNNDIFHAFGLQTVLATWLVRDGYGLATRPEAVDFAGYTGYYIGRHLYLIEEGMTDEAVTAIVEKYDSDKKFQADNLVVFGYNFGWTKLQALRDNLIRLKDTEKNLRVMFDVRY